MITLILPRPLQDTIRAALLKAGRREIGGILMAEHVGPNEFEVKDLTVHRRGTVFNFVRVLEDGHVVGPVAEQQLVPERVTVQVEDGLAGDEDVLGHERTPSIHTRRGNICVIATDNHQTRVLQMPRWSEERHVLQAAPGDTNRTSCKQLGQYRPHEHRFSRLTDRPVRVRRRAGPHSDDEPNHSITTRSPAGDSPADDRT